MAGVIAVKDEASAKQWVAKAEALNQRADELNKKVGALLRALGDGGVGDIVTTLVQYGTQTLQFAQQIFDGVTQICQAISGLVDMLKDVVSGLVNAVKGIAGSLG